VRVKLLDFGTNWWARFGSDPADPDRYTRHAAYYNSTGIRCGRKVRRHWIVPGLIRFNGVGDFNPRRPHHSLGRTFLTSNLDFLFGGNRLLVKKRVDDRSTADFYLLVISQDLHGRIDFSFPGWKSSTARIIAASQLRHIQEVMLMMKPGDWIITSSGTWTLTESHYANPGAYLEFSCAQTCDA
jgi:hypothetical protein